MQRVSGIWIALGLLVALPVATSAQTSEIAGVVRDGSGGVLPGVTVTVESPALIEQSRTVFTDGQGNYRAIALVPGEYTVTFSLVGFSTVISEGLTLGADFTASIDAEMAVGAINETITVSGQAPLVNVETVTQRRALTTEVINDLPTGRSFQNLAILVPGVQVPLSQQDVGGASGANWQTMEVHGSRGDQMPLTINGMFFNNMNNTGGGYNHTLAINTGTIQEMTITTSGLGAESRTSGVVANSISKEGGNQYSFYLYGDFTNESMQSNNLSQDLINRGLDAVNRVKEVREINPAVGGPIVKDKLWFYAGYRDLVAQQFIAGTFEPANPTQQQYCRTTGGCDYGGDELVPDSRDLSQQSFSGDRYHRSYTTNLTWQATERDKFNFYWHLGERHKDNDPSLSTDPTGGSFLTSAPDYLAQAQWVRPVTSRLLLEGGATFFNETWWWLQRPYQGISIQEPRDIVAPVGITTPKYEASTGTIYGANHTNIEAYNHQYNMRFAVNYVTGSHAIKVGMTNMWGTRNYIYNTNDARFDIYFNGAPVALTQYARPLEDLQKLKTALGVYAQDRWTFNNVTLNLGVRFDFHNAGIPSQEIAALQFVPAVSYAEINDAPSWKDISPRLGFAWDIAGSGRSVLRANYGTYLASESTASATANNPVNTRINSAGRGWFDANGDFTPDCDLQSALANGECGGLSAPLGDPNIVTTWDQQILNGWGVRPSDSELLVGFQQLLTDNITADMQWTYHWYDDFFVTQNRSTPAAGFDSYCINAPTDARLPGGGGNEICGFMDINPGFFGLTPDNLVQSAANFGDVDNVYSGADFSLTARLPNGGVASGGVSIGRERMDICDVIGSAEMGSNASTSAGNVGTTDITTFPSTLYCRTDPPYQADFKALVTYPLRWGMNVSATWQNRAGPQMLASHVVTSAETDLGRPLSLNTATINLVQPGTQYGDRVNQLDLRVAKSVNLAGGGRIQPTLAFYNLFNANPALTWSTRFGPNWLTPTRILQGRMVKVGVQMDF